MGGESDRTGAGRRKTVLVTTTVRVPLVLRDYLENFGQFGHDDVSVLVVGDLNTPEETARWVCGLAQEGHDIEYLGPTDQERWLERFPALRDLLPWHSIQRRNVGYLRAGEIGADVSVSIDDDNYPTSDDYLAGHRGVGEVRHVDAVTSSNGWFNVCQALHAEPPARLVPRGFPQSSRHDKPELQMHQRQGRVVVNAGLWLDDPDVDAVTRLVTPTRVTGLTAALPLPIALGPGTRCPFNSQNTAFDVRVLPCLYLIVMGAEYRGLKIGRYDDIWMSYVAQTIIAHLGDLVTFGFPLVRQVRNPHDHLEDLALELPGMLLTDPLLRLLQEVQLTETTYLSAYGELIELVRAHLHATGGPSPDQRRFFMTMLDGMAAWADACARL